MGREHVPIGSKLTQKQRRFASEYALQPLGSKDAHKAALAAGYSPKIARTHSWHLLRHPNVREKILELDPGLTNEQPSTAGLDAQWVLLELAGLWSVDLLDLFADGRLRRLEDMPPEARRLISSFEVVDGPEGETVTKVKLVDRHKILQDIARHRDVMAFEQEKLGAETDRSLARLLDAAASAVERSAPERALDVTPGRDDDGNG